MGQEKKPALTPEESQEAAKQAAAQAAADVGKNKLLVLRQKWHVNMVCILFLMLLDRGCYSPRSRRMKAHSQSCHNGFRCWERRLIQRLRSRTRLSIFKKSNMLYYPYWYILSWCLCIKERLEQKKIPRATEWFSCNNLLTLQVSTYILFCFWGWQNQWVASSIPWTPSMMTSPRSKLSSWRWIPQRYLFICF